MSRCALDNGRPKKRFETRSAANEFAKRWESDPDLKPYRCVYCGWFHLGHYPTNPAIRAKLRAEHRQTADGSISNPRSARIEGAGTEERKLPGPLTESLWLRKELKAVADCTPPVNDSPRRRRAG